MSDDHKVVALPGHTIRAPDDPSPALVAFIEGLLEDAKAGLMKSIAIAEVCSNGSISHGWAFAEQGDLAMGAALCRLQHAYGKYLFERGE